MKPCAPCSHQWIDPQAPPIARQPVAPFIEPGNPRAMEPGKIYVCQRCRQEVRV